MDREKTQMGLGSSDRRRIKEMEGRERMKWMEPERGREKERERRTK